MWDERLPKFLKEACLNLNRSLPTEITWVKKDNYITGVRRKITGVVANGLKIITDEYVMRVAGQTTMLGNDWLYGYLYSQDLKKCKWGYVKMLVGKYRYIKKSEAKMKLALFNL